MRTYTFTDRFLSRLDATLNTLFSPPDPGTSFEAVDHTFSPSQYKQSIALMRVNHCGEVCAQALYLGQALVAHDPSLAKELYQAAAEEKQHLNWCAHRIHELNGQLSLLNPIFAVTSFGIGIIAGLAGDKISLGFLAETENQVTRHLEKHLTLLPAEDLTSRAILTQMHEDEQQHATHAIQLGGIELPGPICFGMQIFSKIMTITTRYL